MTRTVFGAAALVLATSLCVTVAAQRSFHAETRLVVLNVTVTNRHGELVGDLDRDAFSVYENGRPQPISVFRRDDVPTSLGVIIDNSGSMRSLRAGVEEAALAFVRASNPDDDVFVMNFADKARVDVPFTNDIHVLEDGIARVDSIGGTAMRDAIVSAESYLREHGSHDRRALLLITDGGDNASQVSRAQLRKVIEHTGAAVFAVSLAREDESSPSRKDRVELDDLTELTGGECFTASIHDVDRVVLDIAHRIRQQYTIAYTPANQALDGSYRNVRVKMVKPSGLTARSRSGYWATPVP
ncbi:MAG TPA: VWA domain-containing protein [Vicinamibacterales bacterium]